MNNNSIQVHNIQIFIYEQIYTVKYMSAFIRTYNGVDHTCSGASIQSCDHSIFIFSCDSLTFLCGTGIFEQAFYINIHTERENRVEEIGASTL
jgi:hypothetical protein